MTSASNSPESYLSSKTRGSKLDDNYLKELNEDLKLRKQELLEILKPLEDKNNLLFQKLMSNLEEKQRSKSTSWSLDFWKAKLRQKAVRKKARQKIVVNQRLLTTQKLSPLRASLQIMRQIMAGKGNDDASVIELVKEAEEMKQNLERKNKMLRKEMEMLWNKTFNTEEFNDEEKVLQIKNKTDLQDGKAPKTPSSSRKTKNELETLCAEKVKEIRKEKKQRKMEWVRYQEQANIIQNDFNGKVIELRIEALKNYQKANDLKLSLYIQQNFEPKQAVLNLPRSQASGILSDRALNCSITTSACSPSFERIERHKPVVKNGWNGILDTPSSKSGYHGHYNDEQSNYLQK